MGRVNPAAVVQEDNRPWPQMLERLASDVHSFPPVVACVGPVDQRQAALAQHVMHPQPTGTKRRPEDLRPVPSDPLDGVLSAVDLGGDEGPAAEIRKGMGISMVTDGVSLGNDAARNLRVALDVLTAEEERCRHSSLAQKVEYLPGIRRGRAVVEGERDIA